MMQVSNLPLSVSHVPGQCNAYPGEQLVFYTQITVNQEVSDLVLKISLPENLTYVDSRIVTPGAGSALAPGVAVDDGTHYVVWRFPEKPAAAVIEIQTITSVEPVQTDLYIASDASIMTAEGEWRDDESATVVLRAKSKYVRYLPEFFAEDEFLGRFLMLFESFWQPIEDTIKQVHYTFDPGTAPQHMIPWLNSWVGVAGYENMPIASQRELLGSAVTLMRKRGTKEAMVDYLKIFTGGEVRIAEHRGREFRLGADSYLGAGIALGKENMPHTFTVYIRNPKHVDREGKAGQSKDSFVEFEHKVGAIIESLKPAHTNFSLKIER